MNKHMTAHNREYITALLALAIGLIIAWPFLGIVSVAALMAFLSYGLFKKLQNKLRSSLAASLTIVITLIIIIIPVAIIAMFTVMQTYHIAANISATATSDSMTASIKSVVNSTNALLAPVVGSADTISTDGVLQFFRSTLPNVARNLAGFLVQTIGNIPLVIILSIMYLILMYEFLVYGKDLIKYGIALSPFRPKITNLYLKRAGLMATAMVKGQVLISLIISVLSAMVLSVFLGLGEYFFLMSVVFTLLNIAPLGCGILVIPITIIAMLNGMVWQGAVSLALYLVISNLDAVLRPHLIPTSITLSPGLTMLAVFGGLSIFGVMGIVYGPILTILIVTAIQLYLDHTKSGRNPESVSP